MSYPGGKAGPGVFQRLINEIPPHQTYIAACAGHDAIAQFKRPAERTILIDADPEPLAWWAEYFAREIAAGGSHSTWWDKSVELHNTDCLTWLEVRFGLTLYADPDRRMVANPHALRRAPDQAHFVYFDPPYLMSTRTAGKMYRHEFTIDQHARLLDIAKRLPCNVMVSGYHSEMYAKALRGWRTFTFEASVRSGERRTEHCWCNYAAPARLHDSRHVGGDKRQRENVRRRIKRLTANLLALTEHERQAVLDAVLEATT